MTITEEKIEKYYNKFWNVDNELGGRNKIRLDQWGFEVLLYNSFNGEGELFKKLKGVERIDERSILYDAFNGKAIKELAEKIGGIVTKQIDFNMVEDSEVYYFVAYVTNENS